MLKLLPRSEKDSRTPEWKKTLQKGCTLSFSLSHTHTPVCTHVYVELQLYLYQGRDTQVQRSTLQKWGCSQLKLLVWDWKRVGKRSKSCGQAWQGKSRTTAGSRRSKSYGSSDFPCQLHFPILHPSFAHVYHRGHSILQVGRSDWFIHWQALNDTYHVPGIFCKIEYLLVGETSLVIQWLKLCAPNVGGLGSIPSQGTRSHMLQLRVHMLQLRSRHTAMKIKDPMCHN